MGYLLLNKDRIESLLGLTTGEVSSTYTTSGSLVNINTTVSESDMLNQTINANALGANGAVRVIIRGYLLQNQATGTTYTFRVYFGGIEIYEEIGPSVAQSATRLPYIFDFIIFNKNATNSQGCNGVIEVQDTTAAVNGEGDLSNDIVLFRGNFRSSVDPAIDTTANAIVRASVQMSVSNANTQTVIEWKSIEVIKS